MSRVERRLYLDHNATAPLLPEARDAAVAALDCLGNPSSVHAEGRAARALVEQARRDVAGLIGAQDENVVFTSSATEAAATCLTDRWIIGGQDRAIERLAVIDTDHPAVRDAGRFPGEDVTRLPVDHRGIVDLDALDAWLGALGSRLGLLAFCLANGETGVVQPLGIIRERIADRNVLLVLDAVQAAGRMALDLATLGADALVLSGHKLGAMKGVGAFVLSNGQTRPYRLLPGGGQERGLRSGTEAVPAVASFGASARVVRTRIAAGGDEPLRERLLEKLSAVGCRFTLLGEGAACLPNTVALVFPAFSAQTVQMALDLDGFAVSAGSACSSGKVTSSHVLAAMAKGGLQVDPALGLLRISFGPSLDAADLDRFARTLARLASRTPARDLRAA